MLKQSTTSTLARKLLRVVSNPVEKSDRDLLIWFASNRDEDAFAELVRRHGRMVLAVAKRVTGSQQDAEDAFQAAFLVLARRATHIKHPDQLANWLYGVAYRTALEARALRRRVLEHPVSAIPEPFAPIPPDDMNEIRQAIDEELAGLPDKYRSAVVLCDLEGLPRAVAAARLKIPEGTLSSRLAYARKLLASRLTRRGITSTAGVIAAWFAGEATGGALPRELVSATARVASRIAAGGPVPPGLVPPSVSHLTEGVMKIMFANRLRLSITAAALACGLIALGAFGFAQQPFQQGRTPGPDANGQNGNAGDLPPGTGKQQTKQAAKPLFIARGIEDEDVPYGTLPMQAVVRVENGKLIIRRRIEFMEPVTHQLPGNQSVTNYEHVSTISGVEINDPSEVAVFDMKGSRLLPKAWKEKLKMDLHVLLGFDGKLPNPRELTLFKDDTLLIILPASSPLNPANNRPHAPPLPTPSALPTSYGQGYTSVTSYVPQTTYVPRTTYVPTNNAYSADPTNPPVMRVAPPTGTNNFIPPINGPFYPSTPGSAPSSTPGVQRFLPEDATAPTTTVPPPIDAATGPPTLIPSPTDAPAVPPSTVPEPVRELIPPTRQTPQQSVPAAIPSSNNPQPSPTPDNPSAAPQSIPQQTPTRQPSPQPTPTNRAPKPSTSPATPNPGSSAPSPG
jgi:RNA polymerase sigma factor (sigma-70 family)